MQAVSRKEKLPDPLAEIAQLRKKLNPKSSVAKSPFCDVLLSMRMQGVNYHAMERWLIEQGQEQRIPASTIFRNMKGIEVNLPYAEQLAERWGGRIDLDLSRELAGQLIAQRMRVDKLQRQEEKLQETNARYLDKRLRGERELLASLIKDLHGMMKNPMEAAIEAMQADALTTMSISEDASALVTEMILNGEIKLGIEDGPGGR